MTLYHFGNCLALVYAPYHMLYKYSGISEYATFSKFIYAGGLYIFTQLCKMLFLATFFPDSVSNLGSHYTYNTTDMFYKIDLMAFFLEMLKLTVDFADLFGIYYALSSVPGKGHAKILTVGIGWASAEVLVTRSVLLWVGARGSEFDWRYIQSCIESNIALVQHLATATFVWLLSRSDLPRRDVIGSLLFLVTITFITLFENVLTILLGLSDWTKLALRAIHALITGIVALILYLTYQIGL